MKKMSKDKERFKAILTEAAELYFTAEAQQNTVSAGDFTDEVEILTSFQAVAGEFIQITEDQIDSSWREISKKKRFDPERMRVHEVFSAAFNRFKTEFARLEDMQSYLEDCSK
jgi:hypothetical protein